MKILENNIKKKSLKIKESSVELHLKRGTVSKNLAIHGYENLFKSIHSAFADHLLLWLQTRLQSIIYTKNVVLFYSMPFQAFYHRNSSREICPLIYWRSIIQHHHPLDWNSPYRGEEASHQEVSPQLRQREELNWGSQLKSSDQQIFWTMSGTDSPLIRQD